MLFTIDCVRSSFNSTDENIFIVSSETLSFPEISIFVTISLKEAEIIRKKNKNIDDNNLNCLMNICDFIHLF